MSYESGKVTAAITGSVTATAAVPTPSSAQTPTCVKMTANGSAQTVLTPAAGTRFLLYGATTSHTAAHQLQIYDTDGTTPLINLYGVANGNANFASGVPVKIYAAGEALKAVDTNTALYSIWGITETV